MAGDLTDAFLGFLKAKFAREVVVGDAATDVMRQPMFPGLESKPRELEQAPAMPALPAVDPSGLGFPEDDDALGDW